MLRQVIKELESIKNGIVTKSQKWEFVDDKDGCYGTFAPWSYTVYFPRENNEKIAITMSADGFEIKYGSKLYELWHPFVPFIILGEKRAARKLAKEIWNLVAIKV